jgi:hypothetical protein
MSNHSFRWWSYHTINTANIPFNWNKTRRIKMGMTISKTERGKRYRWRELWKGRWLVRGAGAACLEYLQMVPYEFRPFCILISYVFHRGLHMKSI